MMDLDIGVVQVSCQYLLGRLTMHSVQSFYCYCAVKFWPIHCDLFHALYKLLFSPVPFLIIACKAGLFFPKRDSCSADSESAILPRLPCLCSFITAVSLKAIYIYNLPCAFKDVEKRQKKRLLLDYLSDNLKHHNWWAYRYFFCEFLALINVIGKLCQLIELHMNAFYVPSCLFMSVECYPKSGCEKCAHLQLPNIME